jgi:hypothetical protein
VRYLEFLERLHGVLDPPTYLEIGVRHGDSLAFARCPAVGVDPFYNLRVELAPHVTLFPETSDEYFRRPDALAPLGDRPVGMAFVDGMHLVEYALTDFIGVERRSHWTSAVVLDDVLPRDDREAARDRRTREWTGDVFKLTGILAAERPDLVCLTLDTEPTGLLLVLGLDPASRRLPRRYERIVSRAVTVDPQRVPKDVVERRGTVDAEAVLAADFWAYLRDARDNDVSREEGLPALREAVEREFGARRGLRRRLSRAPA